MSSATIEREPLSDGRVVRVGREGWQELPAVLEPVEPASDLVAWAGENREVIENLLRSVGAVLFRGFGVDEPEPFERFIEAVGGSALEYKERSSPRSSVAGHVYTSTDYPADQRIFFHNENSYAHTWPLHIGFCCAVPPESGGATPITDVREVYRRIDPEIRERFERQGILYVRNFSDLIGLPWQTVFQTDDEAEAEAYCRRAGYEAEWLGDGCLRTRRLGKATAQHPDSEETVWFNHATFFHVSMLPASIRDGLLELFDEEDLPNNSYYGDGSPIEPEVIQHLASAYEKAAVSFPWQRGDVMLLDNMLVAHAREPFTGPRKILTAMARPIESSTVQSGRDRSPRGES